MNLQQQPSIWPPPSPPKVRSVHLILSPGSLTRHEPLIPIPFIHSPVGLGLRAQSLWRKHSEEQGSGQFLCLLLGSLVLSLGLQDT